MSRYLYRGWFGPQARRRCPHVNLKGIYGDQIIHAGFWRLFCEDCGQFLDGPVSLARDCRHTDRCRCVIKVGQ